ncbi:MAG: metallopeptidase TldD-related protein [Nocardioidaceae bacterium]
MAATTPQALIDHALAVSTADHCIVVLRQSSSANLRWANNTLTTNGVMTACQLTIVSVVDGGRGMSSGVITQTATSTTQVAEMVSNAEQAAREATPAEDSADVIDGDEATSWADPPGETGIDVFTDFAHDLGEALARAGREQRLLYGYVEHDVTTTYLATSRGLRLRHEQPTGHVSITGKPTDLSTSVWVGQATEDFSDVDVAGLDDEVVRRIGWAERAIELPAGRYDTILPTTAVADLTAYSYFVSSGRDAHEGQTVFSRGVGGTAVGQQIAKRGVRLHSDPGQAGLQALPFVVASETDSMSSVFDNGLPLQPTDWISDGTLTSLATSRHTAQLTGLPLTPPVDNLMLSVDGGHGTIDDLVGAADRALLLTSLWYIREVDPQELLLTGLTRDGVYLVEGGEVVGAVNNFRFNESPVSLLNRFSEAGATQRSFSREWGDWFPRTATPPLRVPDFNMSTVSQAS